MHPGGDRAFPGLLDDQQMGVREGGHLRKIGDHSSSEAKIAVWNGITWGITENGERGMKLGMPPKWNTMTEPVSSAAFHAGSHSSPW